MSSSPLSGLNLTACTLEVPPYLFNTTPPTGIAISYLHRLETNLNFTTNLQPWDDSPSALLEALNKSSSQCDLAVAPFAITNARFESNIFLSPFASESYRMLQPKAVLNPTSTPWFVFRTFSPLVWLLVFLGIFLHAIGTLLYAPSKFDSTTKTQTVMQQLRILPVAVLKAYAHLIGHPVEQSTQIPSFHRAAWLILGLTSGLFLLAVYESSLTVLLFENSRESQFESLDDIKRCAIDPSRVAMVAGSASQEFWNFAVNTTLLREECKWDVAGVTVETLEQGFQRLESGEVEYFFDLEGVVMTRANEDCGKFVVVGEGFFSTSVGFVVGKGLGEEAEKMLSKETMLLREADEFEDARIFANHLGCDKTATAIATVGASDLWAFFGMYGGIWGVLLGYRLWFLSKKQGRMEAKV
eukprot:GFKZ01005894.1.p1 GENE.GFKZ01005894.1~~GFKZ01005894.1.p1  ORF type:complete len:413 (-),score=51.48 GFKZ01005894.1:3548-4786(-)